METTKKQKLRLMEKASMELLLIMLLITTGCTENRRNFSALAYERQIQAVQENPDYLQHYIDSVKFKYDTQGAGRNSLTVKKANIDFILNLDKDMRKMDLLKDRQLTLDKMSQPRNGKVYIRLKDNVVTVIAQIPTKQALSLAEGTKYKFNGKFYAFMDRDKAIDEEGFFQMGEGLRLIDEDRTYNPRLGVMLFTDVNLTKAS